MQRINPKWYVMAAVVMGSFLGSIDGSLVNIALPTLATDLNVEFSTVQWVVLGYLLTGATLTLGVGRLADMLGRKKIFVAGFIVFTLSSALCGLSTSVVMLIASRVLQGIGSAMMGMGMAIITEAFPAAERGKALGLLTSVIAMGVLAGPALGGFILAGLNWHWLFLVNLPLGVVGIFLAIRYVPALRPSGGERFDVPGALVLLVGLSSLLLGFTTSQSAGFGNPTVIGLLAGAVIFLALFVFLELRLAQPMVDLRLFKDRFFAISMITGLLSFVGTSGPLMLMPFYLQNILKFPPQETGMLLAVLPLTYGLVAPLSGRISDRIGPRLLTTLGLFLLVIGYVALTTLDATTSALGYALRTIPIGLGWGLFQTPNNSAVMGLAPKNRLGVVSGLLGLNRSLGQTTGMSLLGAFWAVQVVAYAGPGTDAARAPAAAQIAGLHDTITLVIGILSTALLLSLWALYQVTIQKPILRPETEAVAAVK